MVVVIFHDHGSRYVGKMFNDDWVRDRGFMEAESLKAISLIQSHGSKKLLTVDAEDEITNVFELMTKYDISHIPVRRGEEFIGSLNDSELYSVVAKQRGEQLGKAKDYMSAPYEFIDGNASLQEIAQLLNKQNPAVLVKNRSGEVHIITIHDVLKSVNPN